MKHFSSQDLVRAAQKLRAELGIDDQLPPDMIDVLERMQRCGYISRFICVPDKSLRGVAAIYKPRDRKIYLQESIYSALKRGDPKARSTIAHELGHIILGHAGRSAERSAVPSKKTKIASQQAELEAQTFAAAFLTPIDMEGTSTPLTTKTSGKIKPRTSRQSAEKEYDSLREKLEKDYFGSYVMINTDTAEYVVAPTTSEVHGKFIERFGEHAPGWCTRIGASAFATA